MFDTHYESTTVGPALKIIVHWVAPRLYVELQTASAERPFLAHGTGVLCVPIRISRVPNESVTLCAMHGRPGRPGRPFHFSGENNRQTVCVLETL